MSMRRSSSFSPEQLANIAKKVEERQQTMTPSAPVKSPPRPYHEAAAVLSCFEPHSLNPVGPVTPEASTRSGMAPIDALIADSVRVAGDMRYALRPEARVAALRRLREEHRIEAAVKANACEKDDPTDRVLRWYLTGSAPPPVRMTTDELAAAREVTEWLSAAGFTGLPSRDEIIAQFEWLGLLDSFRHIAGDQFAGRVKELATLREYADVLPPQTFFGTARAVVARALNFTQKPPLVIYGPGGVGKSSLISRFILEHAEAQESDRFPFAYLDFDRTDIDFKEPLTLLIEAVRQLGIQYPQARDRCDAIRSAWLRDLGATSPAQQRGEWAATPQAMSRVLDIATRDYVELLASLGAADRPVLFVLDTFEEVQRRSDEYVEAIWRLIETLRASIARMRVVIVGRAELPAKFRTQMMALTGLDHASAVAYLVARGISDRSVAERIARQLGGTPLSLSLAIEVLRKEEGLSSGSLDIKTRDYLFLRVDDGLIQRQLYTRILSYIQDEEVRRLAHPGLVLRSLTPELILEVLKIPCQLDSVKTLDDAKNLFGRIRKEVALVTEVDSNTVKHRPDLRKLMVPLVRSAEASKAKDVDERAVAYFSAKPDVASRAEEIYHRLWLDEPTDRISSRWMVGVDALLATAVDEFSGARKAYLAARLGQEVDHETRELAALEDWERLTERKAADLLASDRPEDALELIQARADRSTSSPLPLVESQVLVALDRVDAALNVLETGIARAIEAGDRDHALALAIAGAKIVVRFSRGEMAAPYLSRLQGFRQASAAPLDQLRVIVPTLAMATLAAPPDEAVIAGLRSELSSTLDAIADSDVSASESLLWAMTMVTDPKRLSRLLRLVTIHPVRPEDLRRLAGAVAQFDVAQSPVFKESAGALARKFKIDPRASVTETWSDYFVKTPPSRMQEMLAQLLDQYAAAITPEVVDAICNLPRFAAGVTGNTATVRATPGTLSGEGNVTTRARGTLANAPDRVALADAIEHAFPTVQSLSELLRFRLERQLESITPTSIPLPGVIENVITAADAGGWLQSLVRCATEAVPSDRDLAAIAGRFGVATLQTEFEAVFDRPAFLDVQQWRERLSLIEGQVCRVEVARSPTATGFLIGEDLVLTAEFAVSDVIQGHVSPKDVALRFDYKGGASGTISEGTVFRLASDWLVSRDPWIDASRGLGFALLRLASAAGYEPIGGATLESTSNLRRWIQIPDGRGEVQPGSGLIIVQHPLGAPLKVAFGERAILGRSDDGTRFFHSVNTEPGSSGAPCFSTNFELVGMHIGSDGPPARATRNVAVSIAAIRDAGGSGDRFTQFA